MSRRPVKYAGAIERAIRATTWNTPALVTALATEWIADGTVTRMEALKRADARQRQNIAREILNSVPMTSHLTSYFAWLPLAEGIRGDQIAACLNTENIAVSTAEPFSTGKDTPHALRLALGSVTTSVLRSSLLTVRNALHQAM